MSGWITYAVVSLLVLALPAIWLGWWGAAGLGHRSARQRRLPLRREAG